MGGCCSLFFVVASVNLMYLFVIVDYPNLVFRIKQVRVCPALMVAVPVGAQSGPRKVGGVNPDNGVSVTVKVPGPNVTS
jgi:hypothetical protein